MAFPRRKTGKEEYLHKKSATSKFPGTLNIELLATSCEGQ